MIAPIPVPKHYLGLWQRKHLASPEGVDNSSHVFWLQTSILHADIRVPADRPAFNDRKSLHDYSLEELKQLARQQGFAGETNVVGNSCVWLRHIDYQPQRTEHDIGYMEFMGPQLKETGAAKNYLELWERLPDSQGATYAFQFIEEHPDNKTGAQRPGIFVVSGDYFIFVRDRNTALPKGLSLEAMVSRAMLPQAQLIEWMDFEISFGRVANGNVPWEIQLSTLPFREGSSILTETEWTKLSQSEGEYVQQEQSWNGEVTRRWQCSPELHSL